MKTKPIKVLLCSLVLTVTLPAFAANDSSSSETGSKFAADASQLASKAANLVKDSAITGYIYAQIALDKNLSKLSINVSTEKGVVSLEGKVDSDSEASALVQLASSASGVKSVDTAKLKVIKSSQPFTDLIITAKVKGTFIREKLTEDLAMPVDIHVETKNGVVYLTGTASNSVQTDNAIKLAQAISGVVRVESNIKLVSTN